LRSATAKRRPPWLPDIEAVGLDVYGTIIDFGEPQFIQVMAEICDRQGLEGDAADLWRRFLRVARSLRSENTHRPLFRGYHEAWLIEFERVFRQLGLNGDPEDAAFCMKEKLAEAPAFAEASPFIGALHSRYRLAILSNADDDFLLRCLAGNGLHFDIILSSERAGAVKPDPAIFQHLALSLGLPAERILYVGDSPIPDVLGGKQAGLRVAWVNRYGYRRPRSVPVPDIRVRSLTELLPILGLPL
jgi:2-haloalkanoic acid dehalogenase type II